MSDQADRASAVGRLPGPQTGFGLAFGVNLLIAVAAVVSVAAEAGWGGLDGVTYRPEK